jgi:hypothetical protein
VNNNLAGKWPEFTRECSETSAFSIQTPGNYPEENIPQRKFLNEVLHNKAYNTHQILLLTYLLHGAGSFLRS